MQHLRLCNLSKSSLLDNVDVINAIDVKGPNQVQIEFDLYILIFVLLEYIDLPQNGCSLVMLGKAVQFIVQVSQETAFFGSIVLLRRWS